MAAKKDKNTELTAPVKAEKHPKANGKGASGDTNEGILNSELKNTEHGKEQPGR